MRYRSPLGSSLNAANNTRAARIAYRGATRSGAAGICQCVPHEMSAPSGSRGQTEGPRTARERTSSNSTPPHLLRDAAKRLVNGTLRRLQSGESAALRYGSPRKDLVEMPKAPFDMELLAQRVVQLTLVDCWRVRVPRKKFL